MVKTGDDFDLVHQHDFQERVSATPAIDGSTIYIRTKTQLFAFRSNQGSHPGKGVRNLFPWRASTQE